MAALMRGIFSVGSAHGTLANACGRNLRNCDRLGTNCLDWMSYSALISLSLFYCVDKGSIKVHLHPSQTPL